MDAIKDSVGVWAFGPAVTRFVPPDYHHEVSGEDQVAAVRRTILHWEFIWDLAEKIDREALKEAKASADALAGQRPLYGALGLDDDYEAEIVGRRKEAKQTPQERAAGSARSEG